MKKSAKAPCYSISLLPALISLGERTAHRVHILLYEGNPISLVFQNIDPPSPSPPGECLPPAFVTGGGQTRRAERGMGGQYFGRREK
jgi:hypothetical protein